MHSAAGAFPAVPDPLVWGVGMSEQELSGTTGGGFFHLVLAVFFFSAAAGVVDALIFGGCRCDG